MKNVDVVVKTGVRKCSFSYLKKIIASVRKNLYFVVKNLVLENISFLKFLKSHDNLFLILKLFNKSAHTF